MKVLGNRGKKPPQKSQTIEFNMTGPLGLCNRNGKKNKFVGKVMLITM